MGGQEPQFLDVDAGAARRRIAILSERAVPRPGRPECGVFWLSGFKSDMASTKATALSAWAGTRGISSTRFDYSGHGQSEGRFEDGTLSLWLDEAQTVFLAATKGSQILVGSSMGGYLALLLLRRLMSAVPAASQRIKALVLIAPAWDMTDKLMAAAFTADQRQSLTRDGVVYRPSEYGEPYAITRNLIDDGRLHLLAGADFDPGRPVHILQGARDVDVPAAHVHKLAGVLRGGHVTIEVVPDGDHRLSRPQDLERLYDAVARQLTASSL